MRALEVGQPQKLEPIERTKRIETAAQLQELSPRELPELVNASYPGVEKDNAAAN